MNIVILSCMIQTYKATFYILQGTIFIITPSGAARFRHGILQHIHNKEIQKDKKLPNIDSILQRILSIYA